MGGKKKGGGKKKKAGDDDAPDPAELNAMLRNHVDSLV